MRELLIVCWNLAPRRVIGARGLRITRLDAVVLGMRRSGIDRVGRLLHAPPTTRNDDRILDNVAGSQRDFVPALVLPFRIGPDSLKHKLPIAFGTAEANRREVAPFALIELVVFDAEPR